MIIHFRSAIAEPEFKGLYPTEGDRSCLIPNRRYDAVWTRECKHGLSPEPIDPDLFAIFPLSE